MSSALAKAIALAAEIHATKTDKGGKPYILHPIRVMEDVIPIFERVYGDPLDVEAGAIMAVLHDTVEDNDLYTRAELKRRIFNQFGGQVMEGVTVLTHDSGDDYLEEYVAAIISYGSFPLYVKMADLRDNLNILRQPKLDDKALLRIQRYHIAYRRLREAAG